MSDRSGLDLFRLDGRVALVTGASSGLGARFARVLAGAGAGVVVAARRADRLEALVAELDDAVAVPCDVADPAERDRLLATALDRYGRVDVLVNNAGVGTPAPAESETVERFREVVEINVTAAFALTQAVGRSMLEAGSGSVVNISSRSGRHSRDPLVETVSIMPSSNASR